MHAVRRPPHVVVLVGVAIAALPAAAQARATWLAGDLHVHTCYSHDVLCLGVDDPPAYEPGEEARFLQEAAGFLGEIYTYGFGVGARFKEARARGLRYMAISDHNDLRSVADRGSGRGGVIAISPTRTRSTGTRRCSARRGCTTTGPAGRPTPSGSLTSCAPTAASSRPTTRDTGRSWRSRTARRRRAALGLRLRGAPDTIEVLNPTSLAGVAEDYSECWLSRGARIGATGGSDSHWAAISAVQGAGNPTTWVLAHTRDARGVLDALRAGRTTISKLPPNVSRSRLLLEADGNRDGVFEATIGDTVAPGVPMRVRLDGTGAGGFVRVRANGETLVTDAFLSRGRPLTFTAPSAPGWVRAVLTVVPAATLDDAPGCASAGQPASTCAYDHAILGLTSPIYLATPAVRASLTRTGRAWR